MEVDNGNSVTAPGDSDPQVPAVVGGSGVAAGSNVAGPLRSSSIDREGTGVASQAPVTLATTSAGKSKEETKGNEGSSVRPDGDSLQGAVIHLRKCIATQDGGYKLLLQKASALDTWSVKTRSPELKSAIEDLLGVIAGLKGSRESVFKAFNALTQRVPKGDQVPTVVHKEASAQTEKNPKVSDPISADNDGDRSTAILSAIAEVRAIVADQQGQLDGLLSRSAKDDEINQRSDTSRERKRRKRARTRRRGDSQSASGQTSHLEDEDEGPKNHSRSRQVRLGSAMETDTEKWTTVVKKPTKRKNPAPAEPRTASVKPKAKSKKPPAILIRPLEGQSYADTVRTVRSCGLSRSDIGTNVNMRETKDGSLLLELPGGSGSGPALKKITSAISAKLGDSVGKVLQLGAKAEVEILDLDAAATATEVLVALREAIPGGEDPAARAERDTIEDVRIWPTRSGQQVATAKMSRYAASVITKIPVGWTLCRVRPRTLPPERCFRCQKFGHNARNCNESDRAGACWRCGDTGHRMKECKAAEDSCLACDLAGLSKVPHKPGSGSCAARKMASSPTVPRDG
ncbi:uncharacterized protein LOC126555603 [Aphis gossypii]|uniref:uncharacterized protein LOC126555603 n=1 Tax=Aphis gossypii TaxID=80765 RepID=UPI0021595547|nr:uncharacterized protein LOC126555603 [Aphis gossypii]